MTKRKTPAKESGSEAVVASLPASPPATTERPLRPALTRALQAVRDAVSAVLDLADAAAEAVTKGLQARR